jgi:hypothetical protein
MAVGKYGIVLCPVQSKDPYYPAPTTLKRIDPELSVSKIYYLCKNNVDDPIRLSVQSF